MILKSHDIFKYIVTWSVKFICNVFSFTVECEFVHVRYLQIWYVYLSKKKKISYKFKHDWDIKCAWKIIT